ncbi:MAG: bacterial transcriptional activator domain-containing protein [Clostridiales bacterium]
MSNKNNIKIKTFGDFSIIFNGENIIPDSSNKNKVLYFLQYIIQNRYRSVSQQELIDIILANDECSDPINTLKNLAYRSRQYFKNAGLPEKEYVYYRKGSYGFIQDNTCSVDTEEFEKHIAIINNSDDNKKILTAALSAIKIYNGDFLHFSYEQTWVIPLSVKYQDMFIKAMDTAAELLMEKENYGFILEITEKGISMYPYNENFYILRMKALYSMGKIKNAIGEYETISALLFDEMGVSPSEPLQEIYLKATASMSNVTLSVHDALTEIMESPLKNGSFYCSYQMFANTCRFLTRHIARNGLSAFLILCTMTHKNNEPLSICEMKKNSETFHKSISSALRQSDIYTRCAPSQFLVLLLGSNQENAKRAMNRVNSAFKKRHQNNDIILTFQYASHVDLSHYSKQVDINWKANQ